MSITISLIAGPFDDILSWPSEGTIQISVFRQDNSSLVRINILKTSDKTAPCFTRPSPLQPNPSCGIFFYLPHEEMFKTHKNLEKNDNVCIPIKNLQFPEPRFQIQQSWTTGKMSCSTGNEKKKRKENFEKLELKTIIFNNRHFDCRCATSNTSPICLHPLQN